PCSVSLSPRPPTSTLFPYTTLFRSRRPLADRLGPRRGSRRDARPLRIGRPARSQRDPRGGGQVRGLSVVRHVERRDGRNSAPRRSEEHTSELQSRENLVCRLLLEKK